MPGAATGAHSRRHRGLVVRRLERRALPQANASRRRSPHLHHSLLRCRRGELHLLRAGQTPSKVDGWLAKTAHAPDFRFAIKLWQRFTHERDTAWTRADEHDVRVALEPLHAAGKLGAVLVQFPWSFKRTEENRTWLGDIVSAFREFPLVVEIRHESWNVPHFYESLAESGVGFVNIDQPLFKKSIKPSAAVTSPVGYVRVHGRRTTPSGFARAQTCA